MNSFTAPFWQVALGIVGGVVALVLSALAFSKLKGHARRLGWYLIIPLILGLFALAFYLQWTYPATERYAQTGLPAFFRGLYWIWLTLFFLGALALSVVFLRSWREARARARQASAMEGVEHFNDLEAAWEEIRVRMDQAEIGFGGQPIILVLAPDEASAEGLIRSARPQLFAEAPEAPAPIHAYASSDGLLLSVAGASAFGAGDRAGAARLTILCRKLLALRPDCPLVRGVVLVFPIEWASQPESVHQAAAIRDDLQTIRRVLKVRCPVFALFTGLETVPGSTEFVRRLVALMSPQMADQRVGFSVPRSEPFSGDLVQRGLTWMSGWFHTWILSLLASDPLNTRGNSQLLTLDYEFRRYRQRLRALLESAMATPRGSEPVLYRGSYFVATGDGSGERAFAAGLLRGGRSRILADHVVTTWTEEARQADQRLKRIAWWVGGIGGGLSLLGWIAIIGRTPWGWLGLLALVIAWAVVLFRLRKV